MYGCKWAARERSTTQTNAFWMCVFALSDGKWTPLEEGSIDIEKGYIQWACIWLKSEWNPRSKSPCTNNKMDVLKAFKSVFVITLSALCIDYLYTYMICMACIFWYSIIRIIHKLFLFIILSCKKGPKAIFYRHRWWLVTTQWSKTTTATATATTNEWHLSSKIRQEISQKLYLSVMK